ncbi:hypothetical protein AB3X96_41805, partial [Paraburkholderia sp. BR13439]|uniref:hypothetical protein n=1 Tax=Paraburkholderia sp. BR13439 TaxID=3236996 RepID=UPI0034CEC70C
MTPREAQNILYAAFVAAALIVQAQPYRDDVHAQRRFEHIVNQILSRAQTYETEVPVEVRGWIAPAPSSPELMLVAQPPAQPRRGVAV